MKRCKLTVKEQQQKVWKSTKGEKQRTRGTEVTIKKIGELKTDETGGKKALFLKQSCSEVIVQSNQEKSL